MYLKKFSRIKKERKYNLLYVAVHYLVEILEIPLFKYKKN